MREEVKAWRVWEVCIQEKVREGVNNAKDV